MLLQASKSCPKCNKSPNLVALQLEIVSPCRRLIVLDDIVPLAIDGHHDGLHQQELDVEDVVTVFLRKTQIKLVLNRFGTTNAAKYYISTTQMP